MELLLICLIGLFTSFSQDDVPQTTVIDGRSYATSIFVEKIPNFPPLKRRLPSEARFATIPLPDTMGTLEIHLGRGKDSTLQCYQLLKRTDGTAVLGTLAIDENASDTIRATIDVKPFRGRQTLFPLDIRIVPTTKKLLFRWILSSNKLIPGGIPTPADVVIDVGKLFPELSLSNLSGNTFTTKSLRGKPAVINWWSTWCSACIVEMPGLDSLVTIFGPRVSYLAIALDSRQKVRDYLNNHQFRFTHTLGNDSLVQILGSGVPRTIVLDEKGIVRLDLIGGSKEMYKEIEKALKAITHD